MAPTVTRRMRRRPRSRTRRPARQHTNRMIRPTRRREPTHALQVQPAVAAGAMRRVGLERETGLDSGSEPGQTRPAHSVPRIPARAPRPTPTLRHAPGLEGRSACWPPSGGGPFAEFALQESSTKLRQTGARNQGKYRNVDMKGKERLGGRGSCRRIPISIHPQASIGRF